MRAALVLAILALPAAAGAYPQFQFSTGAVRCNQCHYAPAGGGLINVYGRSEAGDTISMGGNGEFLHGLWEPPSWLALGADLRFAAGLNNSGADSGVDAGVFPMQGDLYARVAAGDFSLNVIGGLRGTRRPTNPSFSSRLVSREHYLMWRQGPQGWYARAGRFFAPYGLRLAEHPTYVRRWLGFDTLQETYSVSGGYITNEWEFHVTAFTPDFLRETPGPDGSGGALYYERRAGDNAAYGVQARVIAGDVDLRAGGGVVGKLYLPGPRILALAQLDVVHQSFDDFDGRTQLVGYLGGTWFAMRGLMTSLFLERYDPDLSLGQTSRSAVGAYVQWFPHAHFELSLWGRLQMLGTGTEDGPLSELVLLQLHYYL